MWVFFCVLLVVFVLMFGPFCLELKNKRGGSAFLKCPCTFADCAFTRGIYAAL